MPRPYPQRILVGVDGSERSHEAARFAVQLADATGARVIIAAAYGFRVLGGRLESGERAAALTETAARITGARNWTSRIVPALSPAAGLRSLAASEHADLLVLGSRHRGILGEALPGQVARGMLRDPPCAVAIVAPGTTARPIRHIGVLADPERGGTRAVGVAAGLAVGVSAALRLYQHTPPHRAARLSTEHGEIVAGAGARLAADPRSLADDLAADRLDVLVVPDWPHGLRGRLRRLGRRLPTGTAVLVVAPLAIGPGAADEAAALTAR